MVKKPWTPQDLDAIAAALAGASRKLRQISDEMRQSKVDSVLAELATIDLHTRHIAKKIREFGGRWEGVREELIANFARNLAREHAVQDEQLAAQAAAEKPPAAKRRKKGEA